MVAGAPSREAVGFISAFHVGRGASRTARVTGPLVQGRDAVCRLGLDKSRRGNLIRPFGENGI